MGCTTPDAAMDWVNSVSWASSKRVRVWKGFRSMWSRGISSGFPVGSATAVIAGTEAGAGRDGRSDSRPFPRARRFGSVTAGMFSGSLRVFRSLCPAGQAHCAWGGHFVACVPVLLVLNYWVRPLDTRHEVAAPRAVG